MKRNSEINLYSKKKLRKNSLSGLSVKEVRAEIIPYG